jgi:hypothetical protein
MSRGIVELLLQMGMGNPTRGKDRIQGATANPGHPIFNMTVSNILKGPGTEPASFRKNIEKL